MNKVVQGQMWLGAMFRGLSPLGSSPDDVRPAKQWRTKCCACRSEQWRLKKMQSHTEGTVFVITGDWWDAPGIVQLITAECEPEDINLAWRSWQRKGHHTIPWTQHFTSLNHVLSTLWPPVSAFPLLHVKQFEADDAQITISCTHLSDGISLKIFFIHSPMPPVSY